MYSFFNFKCFVGKWFYYMKFKISFYLLDKLMYDLEFLFWDKFKLRLKMIIGKVLFVEKIWIFVFILGSVG